MNRLALVTASLVAALSLTFAAPSSASVATTKSDSRESLLEARANGVLREPKAGSRRMAAKREEAQQSPSLGAPSRDERVDATAARCEARAGRDKLR